MTHCTECDARIWIGIAGFNLLTEDEDLKPVCVICGTEQIKEAPNAILLPPTNEQMKEMKEEFTDEEFAAMQALQKQLQANKEKAEEAGEET